MISHRHRCIMIHIQRTAGSSFEEWLCGMDWWGIEPETKHLTAAQSKEIYSDYWDEYFKFALIRDPWERVASLSKFGPTTGVLQRRDGKLDISGWKSFIGDPPIEHDHRFRKRPKGDFQSGSLYSNMLGDELDFIGRYEDLPQVLERVADKIYCPPAIKDFPWLERHPCRAGVDASHFFDGEGWLKIHEAHSVELEQFQYERVLYV